jgi:hypothetical protein|tara:strand:- start:479 stop:634 length:156 start_codon:yes stop_codon:yes gene_type:complete
MKTQEELEKEYINTFTDKEKKAYEIAKSHLGMSFQIDKSIGFNEWKQKNAK